jgi:hypothetical protein
MEVTELLGRFEKVRIVLNIMRRSYHPKKKSSPLLVKWGTVGVIPNK